MYMLNYNLLIKKEGYRGYIEAQSCKQDQVQRSSIYSKQLPVLSLMPSFRNWSIK